MQYLSFSVWPISLSTIPSVLCLVTQSCLTLCDPMDCSLLGSSVHGDSPGKNTEVGCHALLQRIFPTQRSNPGLMHCGHILYHLSHQRSTQNPYSTPKFGGESDTVFNVKWIQHRWSTFHYCHYFCSDHWSWQPWFSVHGNESLIVDALQVMCHKTAFKWISIKSINNPSLTLPVN